MQQSFKKKFEGRAPDLAVQFIAPLADAIVEHGLGGDILGQVSAEASSLDPRLGQFFTPFCVARLMAAMTMDQERTQRRHREDGVVTMHEPTIGSGVMALAWADAVIALGIPRRDLFIEGWDVEPIAAKMAFVQLSLLDIPARIILGNTLSCEVRAVWETPALIVQREAEALRQGLLRFMQLMDAPAEENAKEEGEDLAPAA